jgi:hypothetical protein
MLMPLLEWGGMLTGVIGAWLVGDQNPQRRLAGFAFFLASNVLWAAWGAGSMTFGLIAMQVAYTITSIRGIASNVRASRPTEKTHDLV